MSSLVGPYRLESLLGAGGMGEVWRAVDTEHDDRPVAVKVLHPGLAHSAEFAERFRREARIAASLRHPHVIPIHRYGEAEGRLYLAMQLVEGEDLSSVLAREGPLSPERAVAVITQVADVLDAAHREGLLHRDVKPSNVRLVGAQDFVYLLDFGIARTVAGADGLTATGQVVGTAAYMAPERFGADPVDHRADVYSLAGLLYSCLTGSPPFDTADMAQAAWAHHHAPVPQPSVEHDPHLAPFDAVVASGLAKDPAARPDSAGELAAAAAAALRTPSGPGGDTGHAGFDAPTVPPSPSPPPRTTAWQPPPSVAPDDARARGRPTALLGGLAALAVIVLAAVVALAVLPGRSDQAPSGTAGTTPSAPTAGTTPTAPSAPTAPTTTGAPRVLATPAPLAAGTVAPVRLGADPFALALSPDGRFAYAGNENGASVSVVDTTVNRTVATVATGRSPSALAVSPDGATVWAATDDGVDAIDTATNTVARSAPLADLPSGIVVSPDGRRLRVALTDASTVTDLDAASLAPLRTVPTVPAPGGLAAGPDGATLAVTSLDAPTMALLRADGTSATVALPAVGLVPRFSPDGRAVAVADAARGAITVVDVASGRVVAGAPAGGPVAAVAFSPDGRTAYAHADGSDGAPGTLLALDTATWTVRSRTPVPASNSADLAVSPDGSRVYVVDQDAGSLLVTAPR